MRPLSEQVSSDQEQQRSGSPAISASSGRGDVDTVSSNLPNVETCPTNQDGNEFTELPGDVKGFTAPDGRNYRLLGKKRHNRELAGCQAGQLVMYLKCNIMHSNI